MSKILTPTRHGLFLPPKGMSLAQVFAGLDKVIQEKILEAFDAEELTELQKDWRFLARREQLPPEGDWWRVWVILAGRGFGKGFAGSSYTTHIHKNNVTKRSAIIGRTSNAVWSDMINGESGIMEAAAKQDFLPKPNKNDQALYWPNGTITHIFTAEEPERMRGPNLGFAWCDEFASWSDHSDEQMAYAWRMLRLTLRLGVPETIITTTPRNRKPLRDLLTKETTVVTTGSTYENSANLADEYIEELRSDFEGTRLGKQELYGNILEDLEGGLWTHEMIDAAKVESAPEMERVVVAVDPATSANEGSDLTGIVVAGRGADGMLYVLADLSMKGSPDAWAQKVAGAYDTWQADKVIAEKNQGGDMVEHTLLTVNKFLPIKLVTATRGKIVRAEPIAALYEQRRVKHLPGLETLEEQLIGMSPGKMKKSPDSADAAIWGLTELANTKKKRAGFFGRRLNV